MLKDFILPAVLALLTALGQRGGVFPAQQRPPGDPAAIARGRTIYSAACSACHGADARGGQLGGPNLLRSQLVLRDQNGELIVPVLQNGRPERGMPPQPLSADDANAVAVYLRSLLAAAGKQGGPPPARDSSLEHRRGRCGGRAKVLRRQVRQLSLGDRGPPGCRDENSRIRRRSKTRGSPAVAAVADAVAVAAARCRARRRRPP